VGCCVMMGGFCFGDCVPAVGSIGLQYRFCSRTCLNGLWDGFLLQTACARPLLRRWMLLRLGVEEPAFGDVKPQMPVCQLLNQLGGWAFLVIWCSPLGDAWAR